MTFEELHNSIVESVRAYESHSGLYVAGIEVDLIDTSDFEGRQPPMRILRIKTQPPPGEIS